MTSELSAPLRLLLQCLGWAYFLILAASAGVSAWRFAGSPAGALAPFGLGLLAVNHFVYHFLIRRLPSLTLRYASNFWLWEASFSLICTLAWLCILAALATAPRRPRLQPPPDPHPQS